MVVKVVFYQETNMFKTDAEVEELLNHSNNRVRVEHKGNGQGQNPNSGGHASDDGKSYQKLPLEDKARIGTLASLIGNKNTSTLTGISEPRVSQFKNGMNGSHADPELRKELKGQKDEIQKTALNKVDIFLGMLTEDRISGMDTKDIASSAAKMVDIYDKLGPKNPNVGANVSIQFFAPRLRDINDMAVIEVEPAAN